MSEGEHISADYSLTSFETDYTDFYTLEDYIQLE